MYFMLYNYALTLTEMPYLKVVNFIVFRILCSLKVIVIVLRILVNLELFCCDIFANHRNIIYLCRWRFW